MFGIPTPVIHPRPLHPMWLRPCFAANDSSRREARVFGHRLFIFAAVCPHFLLPPSRLFLPAFRSTNLSLESHGQILDLAPLYGRQQTFLQLYFSYSTVCRPTRPNSIAGKYIISSTKCLTGRKPHSSGVWRIPGRGWELWHIVSRPCYAQLRSCVVSGVAKVHAAGHERDILVCLSLGITSSRPRSQRLAIGVIYLALSACSLQCSYGSLPSGWLLNRWRIQIVGRMADWAENWKHKRQN